jgi:hypothetical protein
MIWQISHMIPVMQVTISEDQVKIIREFVSSSCVQSEIWKRITAIYQILHDLWATQPVVGTGH